MLPACHQTTIHDRNTQRTTRAPADERGKNKQVRKSARLRILLQPSSTVLVYTCFMPKAENRPRTKTLQSIFATTKEASTAVENKQRKLVHRSRKMRGLREGVLESPSPTTTTTRPQRHTRKKKNEQQASNSTSADTKLKPSTLRDEKHDSDNESTPPSLLSMLYTPTAPQPAPGPSLGAFSLEIRNTARNTAQQCIDRRVLSQSRFSISSCRRTRTTNTSQ